MGVNKWVLKWSEEVAQSCPPLCDPMDCSLPDSSIYGIFQARVLEWVAISFSRASSQPRDRTRVSCIADRCFNLWATREAKWVLTSGQSSCPGLCVFQLLLTLRQLNHRVDDVGICLVSASLVAQTVKNLPAVCRTWSGRSPGEGNGNPLQYSCLENPMERSLSGCSLWGHKELDMTERRTKQQTCGVQCMQQPAGAAAWGTFNTSGTILGTEDLLGSTRRHCLSVCNVIFYSLPTLDLKKKI